MSFNGEHAFVAHGNSVSVYRSGEEDMRMDVELPPMCSLDGESFSPSGLMTYDQDRQLLMLNSDDPFKVFAMDGTRGKIVEEWTPNSSRSQVHSIAPSVKNGQSATFLGLNNKSIMTLDPRVPHDKAV
jgi:hypothetical protein